MPNDTSRGIALAAIGALMLTPDTLLMRLSGLSGAGMLGWRGLAMGTVLLAVWVVTARDRRGDLARLVCGAGAAVICAQAFNQVLFSSSIAVAPVPVVLFGLATVPVVSALLSAVVLNERTGRATWVAIAAVLTGIGIAVLGENGGTVGLDPSALLGAAGGLAVAVVLSVSFVTLRRHPELPMLPAIGTGAILAGLSGSAVAGPAGLTAGSVWAILLAGGVVLPISFGLLSTASRHTRAANVSLLMLTETVLGPVWVWLGTPEEPSAAVILGGAIVVVSLAVYLLHERRGRRR